jgi:hypothetical protein
MYRTIVELSNMKNNDEYILYTKEILTDDDIKHGYIVLSRPVFKIEIDDGLLIREGITISKLSNSHYTRSPEITLFLDALFNMKYFVERQKKISDNPIKPERFLKYYTNQYYDCMSDDLPRWMGVIAREFAIIMGFDEDMKLYPRKEGWYTLKDFCRDFESAGCDINKILKKVKEELPPIDQFLLPTKEKVD